MTNFADDIPIETARAAHNGTSHSPEVRGDSERRGYAATMEADQRLFRTIAGEGRETEADEEFARYREGYKRRFIDHLHSKSRCVSTMIAGPANFNVRRAEKANRSADNKWQELMDFRERAIRAVRRKFRDPNAGPIMSSDDNAAERLRTKIENAEKLQALMKAANKIVRSKKSADEKVAELAKLDGVNEDTARKILEPDVCGASGFPSYKLSNNSANIRRMKGRLAGIERAQATPATEEEGEGGIRFEDAPSDNRVRLYFPDKPDADVRKKLKSNGFRWAPSLSCWQAYRNGRSIPFARSFAGLPG